MGQIKAFAPTSGVFVSQGEHKTMARYVRMGRTEMKVQTASCENWKWQNVVFMSCICIQGMVKGKVGVTH